MKNPNYSSIPNETQESSKQDQNLNFLIDPDEEEKRNRQNLFISKINNFFYGYSVSIIPIITKIHQTLYKSNDAILSFLSSSIFIGFFVGMIVFGLVGDHFGRAKGIRYCMIINLIGVLGCTCSFPCCSLSIPEIFGFFRIISGIGSGGMIPLTMILSNESVSKPKQKTKTGALMGLLQSCGWLIGPVCYYVCLSISSSPLYYEVLWRTSLVISIVAPLYTLCTPFYESKIFADLHSTQGTNQFSVCRILLKPKYISRLIGTGGCYLLYDMISYGTTIISPYFYNSILKVDDTPTSTALSIILAGLFGCSGQFLSYFLINTFSVFTIQLQGFLMNSILFYLTSVLVHQQYNVYLTTFLFYMTFFVNTYGPGTSCVLMPSIFYPSYIKTTCYALSSGCGKLGAIVGSASFLFILKSQQVEGLLITCSYICLLASLLTVCFVKYK